MWHVPRQRKRLYLRIDFERLRPIRPVQKVRTVTNTPVGVLRAVVILPSRLRVAVVHRLLRQTSTCSGSWAQGNGPATGDYARMTGKPEVEPRRGKRARSRLRRGSPLISSNPVWWIVSASPASGTPRYSRSIAFHCRRSWCGRCRSSSRRKSKRIPIR